MSEQEKIEILKAHNILRPEMVFKVSRWIAVPVWATATFLEKETNGGQNVYGHDPTIMIGKGVVTHENYKIYKALRAHTGQLQGVGPMQLTSREFQDAADKIGGCWIPLCNMITGLEFIKSIREDDKSWWEVAKRYNGDPSYAEDWMEKATIWLKRLGFKAKLT